MLFGGEKFGAVLERREIGGGLGHSSLGECSQ
jgi:hypothetical protein